MNKFGLIAAGLGLVGVSAGAFGAHALRDVLAARNATGAWETAVFYQLVHAVTVFALALRGAAPSAAPAARHRRRAALCWIVGVLLFSGSLYFLALGGPRWLGPVTPVGGLALLAGWLFAGLSFLSDSSRP
jgi:uncharacterized membrane protein YgdD (TMEM256/DUF423 family)